MQAREDQRRRAGRTGWMALLAVLALAGTATAACTPAPDATAPSGLAAALTDTGFVVTWQPEARAVGYELRVLDTDTPGANSTSVEVIDPTVAISDLVDGHRYKFNVKAKIGTTYRAWSSSLEAAFVIPVLPVVRLTTTDGAAIVSKDVYRSGSFALEPGNGAPPLTSAMEIKGRGNTTWEALKKPYRIKLETSVAPLGMPKSKHWVLLADYFDPTHLRNATGFALAAETGLAWTPRSRQVEVVLNGVYQGVYELVEHIRIDPNRVNIDKMSGLDVAGDALTGGYLAEIDNQPPQSGEYSFLSSRDLRIHVADPEVPTAEQRDYLRSYVSAFEHALYSAHFADPLTGYRAHLDVASMIDYYLVSEVTRNQDAFLGSTYFTKPRLGKITMGPLWDLDNSMGNDRGWDEGSPTGWFVRRDGLKWIDRLFDDPAFVAEVAARWQVLKPAFEQVQSQVVAHGDAIAAAMAHEFLIWPYRETEIDTAAELAAWLQTRIEWIDANIESPA